MYIYILLISLILIVGHLTDFTVEKQRKQFLMFSGLLLVLVNGLRNIYLGVDDTYNYFNSFEYAQKASYASMLDYSNKDHFYYLFIKFIGNFVFHDFTCYLLLVASFFVWSYYKFINKNSPDILLSVLMFLSLGIFSVSMFLVRQIIAIGFLLFAYSYLTKNKKLVFVLLVIIASLFHVSALIFLIVLPLSYIRFNKMMLMFYVIASILVFIRGYSILETSGVFLIDERFAGYADSERTLSLSGYIQIAILLLFSLSQRKNIKIKYPNLNLDLLYHIAFLALVFQSGASIIAEMFRVALYFKIFILALVPIALCSMKKSRKICSQVLYTVLLLYYVYTTYQVDYAFFWQHYIPKY